MNQAITSGALQSLPWKRWGVSLLAAGAVFALDRWSKHAVAEALPLHTAREIIPGFFQLVHTRNTGIAFSLFADAGPWVKNGLIPALSIAAIVFIFYLQWKSPAAERWSRAGLTLILAGAAGNLYDRAVYGYVVDFLDLSAGGYHWPAFNVADSAITIGAGMLLFEALRRPQEETGAAESA